MAPTAPSSMSGPTSISQRPKNVLRRSARAAFHGTGRASSIRLRNLQSSAAHLTTPGSGRQRPPPSRTNTPASQLRSQSANIQPQVDPPRRWFSNLGINLSNSIIAFFAFIATVIYGVWTWIQSSIANQIARASGALGLVQYCEQYSDTKNGQILCSAAVDLNTIVKQFSSPSTDGYSQIGTRNEAFNSHESSAIRRHEPPGALIFRAIFFVSNLPFQCFEILISGLRKGSHKFQRQFKKYATYGAAILTLSINLAGLGTITIARTYIVVLFAIRDPVEASPNLVGMGIIIGFIVTAHMTAFLAIFLRIAKEPENGFLTRSLKQWYLHILPTSWQQFDVEKLRQSGR